MGVNLSTPNNNYFSEYYTQEYLDSGETTATLHVMSEILPLTHHKKFIMTIEGTDYYREYTQGDTTLPGARILPDSACNKIEIGVGKESYMGSDTIAR
jgi:hypothetical protein